MHMQLCMHTHLIDAGCAYMAPAAFRMASNSPLSSSFMMPPRPPSLHPPMNSPLMKTAGTLVRPSRILAISMRMPGPSGMSFNSTAVYLTLLASNTSLALMQKGHVVKENMRTGVSAIRDSTFAFAELSSYSPAIALEMASFGLAAASESLAKMLSPLAHAAVEDGFTAGDDGDFGPFGMAGTKPATWVIASSEIRMVLRNIMVLRCSLRFLLVVVRFTIVIVV
mmetsp:Transcript_3540/g.10115  ORF Transcript_3540/g.10115 Transcript_3540/m.10115 type:complete len:224 (+) Transcript_3540:278-949(+)